MKRNTRGKKIIKLASLGAIFAMFGGAIVLFLAANLFVQDLPSPEQISAHRAAQSTKIFDRTGTILLYEVFGEEKRTVIPFEEIPNYIKQATIAVEDKDFYQNPGFSIRSIFRALLTNVLKMELAQGGSTITQQLARNAFLSTEKTFTRKIRELILAIRLERQYSKDKILDLYLNEIPYGSNAYGIEAAAHTFFGKSAKDLTLSESALLASLPQAPSFYSPWGTHTEELMKRKDFVLDEMAKLGFITEEQKDSAKLEAFSFAPHTTSIKAPHFVMAVQDYLIDKYGEEFLRTNGLRVTTTIDYNLQQTAEKVVKEGAERNYELYKGRNAALVAQDAATGQIIAHVGSYDYFDIENEGNFDVATQGFRQPGSAFKPFAYITAFSKGYTPDTVVFDVPTEFDTTGLKSFKPQNFDEKFRGPVNLRNSLAQSLNIPAVKVLYLAGIADTLETAKNFGITTLTNPDRYGLSLVLGSGEVKPIEMVGAYSVFAQDGIKHSQTMILKIEDANGNILEEYKDQSLQVIEPQYTRLVNNILSDISARAPLYSQSSLNLTIFSDHEVAIKTGTTSNYVDAWTIGYTPSLVVGVWVGNNRNEPMQEHGSSILAALPIFSSFMREALKERPPEVFIKPDPIVATKPILRGEFVIDNQIHNILYHVDKNNPEGPSPLQPDKDPQFKNWEDGLFEWATLHIPNFTSFNRELVDWSRLGYTTGGNNQTNPLSIQIKKPGNGIFIQNELDIEAFVSSRQIISRIEVYFNGELLDQRSGFLGNNYTYLQRLFISNPKLQNKLTIKVFDNQNSIKEESVIVYH